MEQLNFANPQKILREGENIIYGAGYNGRLLLKNLEEIGIPVAAFYDDDVRRWNEEYCGKKILSKEEFSQNKDVNVIISSMYVGQIEKKLKELNFARVYEVLEFLLRKDAAILDFEAHRTEDYLSKLMWLIGQFEDSKSKEYFEVIYRSVKEGKALRDIIDLYTEEEQYFVNEVSDRIATGGFVDCGAYTGDTLSKCIEKKLYPKKYYCFEADRINYERLEKYCKELKAGFDIVTENVALWNKKTKISMKNANYNAKVDEEAENGDITAITLDEYFADKEVSFIKMDIEGAERKALQGGMQVIKKQRPTLAISIYHGLDDMVEIPLYLLKELKQYRFLVRHHSYTYSETVLYCIPETI